MTGYTIPEVTGCVRPFDDGRWYASADTEDDDTYTLNVGYLTSPIRRTREQAENDIPRVVAALRTALQSVAADRLPALLPECEDNDHGKACLVRDHLEARLSATVSDLEAARIDLAAMRPVVEAAVEWQQSPDYEKGSPLYIAIDAYRAAKEARND